jgi:hypothetical protein
MTLVFLVIIIGVVFYYVVNSASNRDKHNIIIKQQQVVPNTGETGYSDFSSGFGFFTRPNYAYNNLPGDVLMNPYVPPLSDERYLVPNVTVVPPGRIPINISTNGGAVDTNYRQMGLLTPFNGSQKLLPLMGRPLFTNRNKWQYYTMSDQNNSVKLPIIKNGRNCMNEYGCDELYNGDNVVVEGYNERFKVTIYEKDTIKYIPYI